MKSELTIRIPVGGGQPTKNKIASISNKDELLRKSRVLEHRRLTQRLFEVIECLLMLLVPMEGNALLLQTVQWCGTPRKIRNKSGIKPYHAKKSPKGPQIRGARVTLNGGNPVGQHLDARRGNEVPNVFNFSRLERKFLRAQRKPASWSLRRTARTWDACSSTEGKETTRSPRKLKPHLPLRSAKSSSMTQLKPWEPTLIPKGKLLNSKRPKDVQ